MFVLLLAGLGSVTRIRARLLDKMIMSFLTGGTRHFARNLSIEFFWPPWFLAFNNFQLRLRLFLWTHLSLKFQNASEAIKKSWRTFIRSPASKNLKFGFQIIQIMQPASWMIVEVFDGLWGFLIPNNYQSFEKIFTSQFHKWNKFWDRSSESAVDLTKRFLAN